jgi:phage-related protein
VAITIPILTTFNGRGIDRGVAQFKSLETKGQKASFLLRKAALPAAAALGGIALAAKAGVQGVMEDDKALANLTSTLKSTGNAANITADGFFNYANELQAVTGVGADQITQGAALLGTFKNIRNEAGKGNDVFNRTTVAALDLSKKGFGSLESANKMLGKALNDPIQGITALGRAGVTFTDGQKKTIASLVKSGKTLEAQKIILREVESQVGGTAKAFGETTAGKIERGKRAFEELQKSLAKALLPAIEMFAGLLTKVSGFLQRNEKVVKVAIVALGGLATAVLAVNAALKVMGAISLLASPVGILVGAVAALTAGLIFLEKKTGLLSAAWDVLYGAFKTVWDFLAPIAETALNGLAGAFDAVKTVVDGLKTAVDAVSSPVKSVVNFMSGKTGGVFDGLKRAFNLLFNPIEKVKTAISVVSSVGGPIIEALGKVAGTAFGGLKTAFNAIKRPIELVGAGLEKIRDAWNAIKGVWNTITGGISGTAPARHPITGQPIDRTRAIVPANLNAARSAGGMTANINVQAGLVSTPDQVGQQIIEAIQRAQRRSGPAFVPA